LFTDKFDYVALAKTHLMHWFKPCLIYRFSVIGESANLYVGSSDDAFIYGNDVSVTYLDILRAGGLGAFTESINGDYYYETSGNGTVEQQWVLSKTRHGITRVLRESEPEFEADDHVSGFDEMIPSRYEASMQNGSVYHLEVEVTFYEIGTFAVEFHYPSDVVPFQSAAQWRRDTFAAHKFEADEDNVLRQEWQVYAHESLKHFGDEQYGMMVNEVVPQYFTLRGDPAPLVEDEWEVLVETHLFARVNEHLPPRIMFSGTRPNMVEINKRLAAMPYERLMDATLVMTLVRRDPH
jgi:hypothetical protein